MKKLFSVLLLAVTFSLFAQNPGGVSGSEIWSKVNKVSPTGATFQYKDYSKSNKVIPIGTGTVLTNSLFNYNYSFSFDNSDYVSYQSKLESMKNATVFIVNLPQANSDASIKYALISTDWNPGLPVSSGSVNEQSFKLSTSTFEKAPIQLNYPSSSTSIRPNGRVNTLLWHNFNSKKIFNSYGSNGESTVYVGKSFTGVQNFVGDIPEFIVYRRALSDIEKWKVESYLALKYGITLDKDVNYYSSKNDIFWHKQNNNLFKDRIFGIGKDLNSALNQKQSTSIHDPSTFKKLIFWIGTLQTDNNLNTSHIEDQNFLIIGDNNKGEVLSTTIPNGIKKIDRVWLVEKMGTTIHNTPTSLKYKRDASIVLAPNQAFWLLIDRNANNTAISNFASSNISYYPLTSFDANGYAVYNNLNWASETTTYNQFTFGVGPRMLILPKVAPMACDDTQGDVTIDIKGGQPNFTININGVDNSYNYQVTQPTFNLSLILNSGNYQVTITDATGYTQTALFTVSPTPGIKIDLGPDQNLINGSSLTLNADAQVTSTVATYQWFKDGNPIATTPTLLVTEGGEYKCIITDANTNCSVEDIITITLVNPLDKNNNNGIYPNPITVGNDFHVIISLKELGSALVTVNDMLGKELITRKLDGSQNYDVTLSIPTAGVYTVKVDSAESTAIYKLIINQ